MFSSGKMLSWIDTFLMRLLLVFDISMSCCGKTFYFGVAGPWEGFYAAGSHGAGALHIVVERILKDNATFYEINHAGHEFKYAWTDTECKATVGIPRVADLLYGFGPLQKPIDVLFGGVCSLICEPLGYVAREKNMPMISFGCYSNLLSDKSLYPTHARTAGPFYLVAPMFVAVVKHFKYIRVAVFTGAQAFYSDTAKVIRKELIQTGIVVTDFVILPRTSSGDKPSSITELLTIRRRCKGKMHSLLRL